MKHVVRSKDLSSGNSAIILAGENIVSPGFNLSLPVMGPDTVGGAAQFRLSLNCKKILQYI